MISYVVNAVAVMKIVLKKMTDCWIGMMIRSAAGAGDVNVDPDCNGCNGYGCDSRTDQTRLLAYC